jgi:hypothetical protein
MKLGRRIPTETERVRTAIDSMVNGTISGHSKLGMPLHERLTIPIPPEEPETATAEGTFEEGVSSAVVRNGGTVDVSEGGIIIASGGSVTHGIRFPTGLTLTTGVIDYEMRLAAGSNVSGGGYFAVALVEQGTNIGLANGPDHFLAATTPGVTTFSGQVTVSAGYTFTSNHWLQIAYGIVNPVGIDQSHWEVEVDV